MKAVAKKPLEAEARLIIDALGRPFQSEGYVNYGGPHMWLYAFAEKIQEVLYSRLQPEEYTNYSVVFNRDSGAVFVADGARLTEEDCYCRGLYLYDGGSTVYASMLEHFPLASEGSITDWGDLVCDLDCTQTREHGEDSSEQACYLSEEEFYDKFPVSAEVRTALPYLFENLYSDVRDCGYDCFEESEITSYVVLRSRMLGGFLPWFEKKGKFVLPNNVYGRIHSLIQTVKNPFSYNYDHDGFCDGEFFILSFMGTDGYNEILLQDLEADWYPSCIVLKGEIERLSKRYDFTDLSVEWEENVKEEVAA